MAFYKRIQAKYPFETLVIGPVLVAISFAFAISLIYYARRRLPKVNGGPVGLYEEVNSGD